MMAPQPADAGVSSGAGGTGSAAAGSAGGTAGSRRQYGRRGNNNNNQVTRPVAAPVVVFEGSDPLLAGHIYDVPNGRNADLFAKTTQKVSIKMAGDMGNYAAELSNAFSGFILANPGVVANPPENATNVALFEWKELRKDTGDRVKAYAAFRAKLFLKVYG